MRAALPHELSTGPMLDMLPGQVWCAAQGLAAEGDGWQIDVAADAVAEMTLTGVAPDQ